MWQAFGCVIQLDFITALFCVYRGCALEKGGGRCLGCYTPHALILTPIGGMQTLIGARKAHYIIKLSCCLGVCQTLPPLLSSSK